MSESSAIVLSISANPAVSETRRLVLEQHGYLVVVATNFHEIEQKCQDTQFACAIVGPDIEPKMKRTIAQVLHHVCPITPVLEIIRISPEIEGSSTVQSDDPDALLAAVDDLLKPSGRRFSEQLYRRTKAIQETSAERVKASRQTREQSRQFINDSGFSKRWKKDKDPH